MKTSSIAATPFLAGLTHSGADPFHLLVEAVTDYGIFLLDPAGYVASWNPGAAKSKGYTAKEIVGKHFSCFYTAEDVEAGKPELGLQVALRDGRFEEEGLRRRKGGEPFWAIVTISSLRDAYGQHLGFVNVTRDISERKRAEEALRQSVALNRNLLELLPQRIVLRDRESVVLYCNAAYASHLGRSRDEILGRDDVEVRSPGLVAARRAEEAEILERAATTERDEPFRIGERSGWEHTVRMPYRDEEGRVVGTLAVAEDITERRSLEENLRQSQRLDAIGELAAGVAHDFNNLLGIISGYGELAKGRVVAADPIRGDLDEILDATERAATLARRLLACGRRQVLHSSVLEVNPVVADLVQSLSGLIGREIELTTRLTPGIGRVRADRGQLEQVLLELALNARDAMPGGEPIVVEISELELGAACAADMPAAPGRYVLVTVRDTGSGMDAETQARIFDPYFTTKGNSRSSGLGLSAAHGFARQSGGFLRFESALGVGTTFSIGLPLVDQESGVPAATGPAPQSRRGNETVLLVEDEDALREMVQRILEAEGYAVLSARDGNEALRIAENHGGPIEIVLTDLHLPGIPGLEVAERVVESRPEARILLMSGCGDEAVANHPLLDRGRRLLSKPFGLAALVHSVRELIEAS